MSQGATEGGQDPANGGAGGQGQDPAANGQQGQDPSGGQQQDPQGNQGNGTGGDTFDASTIEDPAVRAYVEAQQKAAKEARDQAARYRTERNALQQQHETDAQRQEREAQEAAAARQTETERLAALEEENRTLKVGGAITDAARDAKAFNPSLVVQMLAGKVELGDDGKPTNLPALLTGLKESDPYLFRRSRNDAGAGGGGDGDTPTTNMNDVIRGQRNARRGRTAD